jgi:hypothetical protein
MLFRVPIPYQAKVIKPRCRNEEDVMCGEWIEFEVREASNAEAPIALRWEQKGLRNPGVRETRWFEGEHHMVIGRSDGDFLTAEKIADQCAKGTASGNPLIVAPDWWVRDMIKFNAKPLAELEVRRVISSDRDEMIARTTAMANTLLIVDGSVWQAVGEPVYEYRDQLGIDVQHLPQKGRHSGDEERMKSMRRFRADRLDDIVDTFQIERHERIIPIDVLLPESVTYDDETPAFMQSANLTIDGCESGLKNLSKECLVVWAELRDAVSEAEADHAPHAVSQVEQCMRAFERMFGDTWHANTPREALKRWDLRPVQNEFNDALSPA